MTVAGWIESLKRFDPAMEVIVRMSDSETEDYMMAEKPSFTADADCGEVELLMIDLANEDIGVEDIAALGATVKS